MRNSGSNNYICLLPLNTNKFVNIAHPDKMLPIIDNLQKSPLSAVPFKSNYWNMLSSFYQTPAYTSEDNNIPIYDMTFTDIQTLKFSSSNDLFNWIVKYGFQNIIYQKKIPGVSGTVTTSLLTQILYDSENHKRYNIDDNDSLTNYDSIYFLPVINYLIDRNYQYSKTQIAEIIQDLFQNLDTASLMKYFNLIR